MNNTDKKAELESILRGLDSAAVAFSGGTDSAFLLKTAHELLGDKVFAVTARMKAVPEKELSEAEEFCLRYGIKQIWFDFDMLNVGGFAANTPERCYVCKKALFTGIKEIAAKNGAACVIEGSNLDDGGDYRPGLRAIKELGVRSPLKEAGLTKADIRAFSREIGLDTWKKPSMACLASRIPYGDEITAEKLKQIELAEKFLLECGFTQVRVRLCSDTARIEILPEEFPAIIEEKTRETVYKTLKALGFSYVTLDIKGYRSGSMNEILEDIK